MPVSEYNVKVAELRVVGKVVWSRREGIQNCEKAEFLLASSAFCQVSKTFLNCPFFHSSTLLGSQRLFLVLLYR